MQHCKLRCRYQSLRHHRSNTESSTTRLFAWGMTGTEITVRTANALEKATEKIDNEAARESRRQAES